MLDRRTITGLHLGQRLFALALVVVLVAPYVPSVHAATSCACVAAAFGEAGSVRDCCEVTVNRPSFAAAVDDDGCCCCCCCCCCCDEPIATDGDTEDAPGEHPHGCKKLCACCIAVLAVPPTTLELPHAVSLFRLTSDAVPAVAIGPAPLRHFHPPR